MDVAVSTSNLYAEGSFNENTSAEMSLVARQARAGWVTKNHKNSLKSPLGRPNTPNR